MTEGTTPDLSELAYHIVSLRDYWKLSDPQTGDGIRAIKAMVEMYFGAEAADRITRSVIGKLEVIETDARLVETGAETAKIELVATFLQTQSDSSTRVAVDTYWEAVFSSTTTATASCT